MSQILGKLKLKEELIELLLLLATFAISCDAVVCVTLCCGKCRFKHVPFSLFLPNSFLLLT